MCRAWSEEPSWGSAASRIWNYMIGCRNKTEQRKVERFVGRYQLAKLNETITDRAIALLQQYRLSHGLLIADGLIAATALVMDKPQACKVF